MKRINGMSGVVALVAMLAGMRGHVPDPTKDRNWRRRRCRRGRHNWRNRGECRDGRSYWSRTRGNRRLSLGQA